MRRIAYADPPYVGQAKKHYKKSAEAEGRVAKEVDHAKLIAHLETFDSWALSLSSPSLQQIIALCPADVRVAGWFKPFCAFKPNVNPAYAWEPVIYRGNRKRTREEPTVRDWVSANITLKRGLTGAKPETFCNWLFDLLGVEGADEFTDLYPGSNAVGSAYEARFGRPLELGAMDGIA